MIKPEGVAAPLEPSQPTPWDIWRDRCNRGEHTWRGKPLTQVQMEDVFEYTRAYAAAVSKNLQQSVEQLCGDLKAIQQDYTNEKKRAENLQEELSLMEKKFDSLMADSNAIIKQRESRIVELESEITALRETKL